jgi:lipopolysaccharide biosynthesis glycosyltransferase
VHLVCAANAAFNMPLCVMLTSVVIHFDPARELVIHILNTDLGPKEQEDLRLSLGQNRPGLENITLNWHLIDPERVAHFSVLDHLSSDAYLRLFAPEVLSQSCDKFVYLDCDLVVLADLSVLYDSIRDENLLLAVHDKALPWVSSPMAVPDYRERGMPAKARHFNSGVMAINLKRWREEAITRQVVEYTLQHFGQVFVDQSGLNACLQGKWTDLDARWNQSWDILHPELWTEAGYSRKEWALTRDHPYIIHYAGAKKPWNGRRLTPRYAVFFKYLDRTVYRGSVQRRGGLENVLGSKSYYYLWRALRGLALMIGAVKTNRPRAPEQA